ncbi:MAG: hypothetical protein ACYCX3_10130 [Thermoleophilia bacterium]
MNFYWRQTIVGLLRYAAEQVPEVSERSLATARELDRTLTSPRLEEAFAVFQDAALRSRNPVYVTGAFYAMRALEEVERWEAQAGDPTTNTSNDHRQVTEEAAHGIVELFERIRRGATLEEALALFPLEGDETSPD